MTDWKAKTLTQWEEINNLAVRRFGEGVLAEEAALAVMDGLRADNWYRVRSFNGKASFTTFVRSLTVRLLEDFARKRFGRVRPPLWVKSFGGIWLKLFQVLCLERLKVSDAVEVVCQRQINGKKNEIEDAAYQLLARIPNCGTGQGAEVAYEDERIASDDNSEPTQDRSVETEQIKELFTAIYQLVLGEEKSFNINQLKKFTNLQINLTSQETLLLKLCYQDGLGVSQAGQMLGLSRFQAHGKMRRLMARLRGEFERTGLDQELRLLLKP